MNNYIYTRLMYPEPDAGGSGGEPEPTTDKLETKTETNVFDFDSMDDVDEQDDKQEQEPIEDDDYALDFAEELGLDKEEVEIFTAAAKKHGVDAKQASGMMSDITKAINENVQKVQAEKQKEAEKTLREEWGSNFESNVKKAGALIKRVGQAAGWTKEMMESFKNAGDMRIFFDIAKVMGTGRTAGLTSAPAASTPMTKADLERELMQTVNAFWNAKASNNKEDAQKYSDRHRELQKMLTGKTGARILLP